MRRSVEGSPLLPMASSSLDRSYERNPGGAFGNCYDSDNNLADFVVIVSSNPQNLSSPLTFCMGVSTPVATFTYASTSPLTYALNGMSASAWRSFR